VLTVPAVQALAKEALHGLGQQPYWRPGFSQGEIHLTELVYRLPDRTEAYYIVGFHMEGRPTGRLIIDATTGAVGQIAGVDDPQKSLPVFTPRAEVVTRLQANSVMFKALGTQPPLDQPAAALEDSMVWRPCDQSHTPFLPFYVVKSGTREAYIRADGVGFHKLTDTGAG
jgi:hypothetical protein